MPTIVLHTPNLSLRHLEDSDAPFILELLHDPGWLRFIGNKSVHDAEGALTYIGKAQRMYREKGFGLWVVERRADAAKLGLCGLIKRDTLHDVDLGFGLLGRYQGQGYGAEAGAAVLEYGRKVVGLQRIVAITSPDNVVSGSLLEKLGFRFERLMQLVPGDDVKLYSAG
jgi:RimJ/RimL family protein N-acetyltransferase